MYKFSSYATIQPTQSSPPKISTLKELPVKFIVNEDLQMELICTPNKLEELAIGWLSSTVCNICMEDIKAIDVCIPKAQVKIDVNKDIALCRQSFSETVVEAIEKISSGNPEDEKNKQQVNTEEMKTAAIKLNSMRSKGLHGAMIYNRQTFVYCEDISRHCAIDKAVGSMIRLGMDMKSCALVTTGRISSELLWKAKLVGLGVVASLKYPSETGILLSRVWGIAIVSRVLSDDIEIF